MSSIHNRATRDKQIRRIQGYENITVLCYGGFEKEEDASYIRETRRRSQDELKHPDPSPVLARDPGEAPSYASNQTPCPYCRPLTD